MFKHDLITPLEFDVEETEEGRFYKHPSSGVKYLSVTSFLSKLNKEGIDKWKKKVGEEEAANVISQSTNKGNGLHNLCEKLLRNEEIDFSKIPPHIMMGFDDMHTMLVRYVNNVRGIELPLHSDIMKLAGRSDCIAEWDRSYVSLRF